MGHLQTRGRRQKAGGQGSPHHRVMLALAWIRGGVICVPICFKNSFPFETNCLMTSVFYVFSLPSYEMSLTLLYCTGHVMGQSHSVCHGDKAVLGPVVKDKPGISKPKDLVSQRA